MAISQFLAMTEAEIRNQTELPSAVAWMACHFSPYGTGLSNIPKDLPAGSLLILNDRTPVCGHDPEQIAQQLSLAAEAICFRGILLDFQRPDVPLTESIVQKILQTLPCPVGVAEPYGQNLDCPVFLPPIPPHILPQEYLRPWQGREIWLELALDGVDIRITKDGSEYIPIPRPTIDHCAHADAQLYCQYSTEVTADAIVFHLMRTAKDHPPLLAACEACGVTTAIGLYQELSYK